MTARILSFPRPPLRVVESFTDSVAKALRKAEYEHAAKQGYVPGVIPLPVQKPRVYCVGPVKVITDPKGAA